MNIKLGNARYMDYVDRLNLWKGSKGKKTNSDYYTILNWARRDEEKKKTDGGLESTISALDNWRKNG